MAATPSTITVTEAATMRALAHPTRLQLLGILRSQGPRQVSELAEQTGQAVGSVSYHLRTLAAHGLIEKAPELAQDGRQSWWRATADFTSWATPEREADPEGWAASAALRDTIQQGYRERVAAGIELNDQLPATWRDSLGSSDIAAFLTAPQCAALVADLDALLTKYTALSDPQGADAREVVLIAHVYRTTP